ncbi:MULTISPECIES: type IV secretory system conjugative DNA transfer family protein [Rhizobium]|uniref:Type IV secretory system conjugative DNA transfer family protein n=2 Tax=Rhizobium TaxID=379 RepID=A0ABX6PRD7_9HYPH|nr:MULTISPECIES: type IV secretory system conjugative DNA transfer family protein [Rhizobium]NKL39352.1 type IV secretion system DNA-binding domain-containing protein [Rhizobium leguminosarum bv. viciae]NKL59874.1 type IV secretion system DNA-binding domain-containing protein [Rhizobium leguminosarum bv. viciae]QIJ45493.1 type IV secretory system conjugative DNA transfer family protein [Rhizobium leguminosarum]QKK21239.1 type IV secretory system conjugative DNA transfer family protein [Rhizobiu
MASVSTHTESDRPKWTGLQRASLFTLPVALLGVVLLWLALFTLIYDAYITSFGSSSYFDYVAQVRFVDAIHYTWSIIHVRNTVGLSLLAFVLASPLLFFLACLWMLKGGRALSRKILYLLHVRSMFSLIAHTALIFTAAYAGVIVYGVAFYMVATRAGEHAEIASYYGKHLAAMYQAPFGAIDAAGAYQKPSRQTLLAALAGLAAAGAIVGFPIGAAIQKRQRMIMGKARLATLKDAADFRLRDKHGIVLGLKQGLLLRNDGDQHVMVIGSPGQGKSRAFVIPTMMSFQGSQVVLDMSGELFEETSGYLKDKGYEVFLLAPGSKFTDGYNPLDLISDEPNQRITDLQKLTQMLLPERLRSDSSDFWEESARILLTAMLGFVLECPDTRKSLSELYRILNSMSDERKAIIQLLENYESVLSDQTRMQLTKFAGRHEKLGEGIAAEIVAKLNFLQNPLVEALTSITTIPIDTIRKRKLVIYIQADWNAMQIYERLISMFIQQMADKLVQMGPLRNGEHEVLMMLDEFGNGGRIDTVLTLAPLIRKNGVRFVFILQDGAQLERLYQRSGQKILMGASTIKLFMNFQNQEDATAVSMAAGKTTEWVEQSSYSHRHGRRQRSISKVPVSVDLLPVNTLMLMKPEEAILQVTGMPLMRIMKLDSGGERMFSKVRKFKPVKRPCMEPAEWTIADSKSAAAAPASTGTDIDAVRFVVKDAVRHVYISSLDELRHRLDLDETREAGVAEEEVQAEKKKQSGDKRKGDPASGQRKRGMPKTPGAARESDIGLDIDEEKLSRNVYSGSPAHRSVRAKPANGPPKQIDPRSVASVLQRQEVREVFGADLTALNDVIFQQAEGNALEPVLLNADVELLIESLSDRLTEGSSNAYLRQFASLARDPLGEDREQSGTEAHSE